MREYFYVKEVGCCGDSVKVRRVIVADSSKTATPSLIKSLFASKQEVIEFKALSKRRGLIKKYDIKTGIIGTGGTIGQILETAASYAVPGDLSPLRSPLRSAAWTAVTPGMPGVRGGIRKPRPEYRCPEGYQYGGRFTDNKLSTCGQMLFDIPGALGLSIGSLARRARRGIANALDVEAGGKPITPGPYGEGVIQSRRPMIPKVGEPNSKLKRSRVTETIKQMADVPGRPTRLVRKDGFVLEPVVSPTVLRAIPDNRDMVDATFILKAQSVEDLGNAELGLLSNTGVTSLAYALPGGSSISISKVRPLTVGERRKLGRTVNSASTIPNKKDPLARLKFIAAETGNGIAIEERFDGIKNPHEIVTAKNGRSSERWAVEVFKNKPSSVPKEEIARETASHSGVGSKISDVDDALAHIGKGGSLAGISPEILQEVLRQKNILKNINGIVVTPSNDKYIYKTPKKEFEHINSILASDLQQHLGVESPDVALIGTGSKRPYLIQDVESTLPGAHLSKESTTFNLPTYEVGAMMISDYLTGIEGRSASTLAPLIYKGKPKTIPSWAQSDLIDLDKIKIRDASKRRIEEMRSVLPEGTYGKYFEELQNDQQRLMRQQLLKLINRAVKFNVGAYKQRLKNDGRLTEAEEAHLNIVLSILDNRLSILKTGLSGLMETLGGTK